MSFTLKKILHHYLKTLFIFFSGLIFSFSSLCGEAPCLPYLLKTLATESEKEFINHSALLADRAIETDLFNLRPTKVTPFSQNKNKNPVLKIEGVNPQNSRTRKAIFKPRAYGDGDGYNRVPMEYVAYYLDRLIFKGKKGYAPPTAYRYNFAQKKEGALLYFAEDAKVLFETSEQTWGIPREVLLSDHRIFNVILQNGDAHFKNMLRAKHWSDGNYHPVFVDHGASMRKGGQNLTIDYFPVWGTGANRVDKIDRITLENLKALKLEDLKALVTAKFITEKEASFMIQIKSGIVNHFQNLIKSKGESNVVIDWAYIGDVPPLPK